MFAHKVSQQECNEVVSTAQEICPKAQLAVQAEEWKQGNGNKSHKTKMTKSVAILAQDAILFKLYKEPEKYVLLPFNVNNGGSYSGMSL